MSVGPKKPGMCGGSKKEDIPGHRHEFRQILKVTLGGVRKKRGQPNGAETRRDGGCRKTTNAGIIGKGGNREGSDGPTAAINRTKTKFGKKNSKRKRTEGKAPNRKGGYEREVAQVEILNIVPRMKSVQREEVGTQKRSGLQGTSGGTRNVGTDLWT